MRFINRLARNFKKYLKSLLNADKSTNLIEQIASGIKNYSTKKDEIVTVINKSAKHPIFVFPPAMLKVAYLPLFEKLSSWMPDFCFHVFHMTEAKEMAPIFGDYIINECANEFPLTLLGYSGGSNIAYDAAVYLTSKQISISKIIMIDGFRWEEGVKYVTITDDSINEMIQDFIKQTNIGQEVINSSAIQKLVNSERAAFLDEARIYQEYCERHRDRNDQIPDCGFVNILSEDIITDGSDTRKGWDKISIEKVRYVQGKGNHLTMLSDQSNLCHNVEILLHELGGI
jgi:thioesterase domain-containing protein